MQTQPQPQRPAKPALRPLVGPLAELADVRIDTVAVLIAPSADPFVTVKPAGRA